MASWCFDSVEKGYATNEAISQTDSIIRNKNVLLGWEFKPLSGFDNSISTPTQQSVENPCVFEVGIAEMLRKQFPQDSAKNQFNSNDNVGDVFSPNVIAKITISGDEESSSKLSSSVVDSNSRESSLIDLKLGGFGDIVNSNSPRLAPILSSAESSTPAKRVRFTSLNSMTIYCQVYGCNKDLSSAKEYHKRHKVCDAHSKTAKVIVNGIEQRFCQQCSRFHLLAEFDDGKRSCRKRLAGHNERRRKPQVGFNSRTGRSLHSFTGSVSSKLQGTTLAATSFICQDILGPSRTEKYPTNGWGRHVKVEDGLVNAQKSTSTCINEQLQPKSDLPPYLSEKHFPVTDSLNNNTGLGSVFSENVNPYPDGLVARSLFQAHSRGSEDLTLFDSASTGQGLPGISESGCALSLLSSQSHNSPGSGHSTAIPAAIPLIIPSSSSHYNMSEGSEKLFGGSSQSITSGVENRYSLYMGSSTATNHPSPMPVLDDSSVNPDFANEILQGSRFMNVNERLSCEDGTTIDLLQLSSQLQRVENQRQPGLVMQENDGFCCLRIT